MRIPIIGGTNFTGPPLVRRLVGPGHEVAVFHGGRTHADLPTGIQHVLGDRHDPRARIGEFRRLAPEVVVDMIAYTEADAPGLVETFRGPARLRRSRRFRDPASNGAGAEPRRWLSDPRPLNARRPAAG